MGARHDHRHSKHLNSVGRCVALRLAQLRGTGAGLKKRPILGDKFPATFIVNDASMSTTQKWTQTWRARVLAIQDKAILKSEEREGAFRLARPTEAIENKQLEPAHGQRRRCIGARA